ncbi:carbon-nitrogen hydrolase family protein [Teredinibacter turnerae]|uniref:carbon-nitrogen hydrolase family protein n=1 Tax=Teredinibacter turnerae TaxID=2426 RepID=UPI0003744EDE|nr:carbon-nitrogen hydrolase family protein [Teredinibacter turnerae]
MSHLVRIAAAQYPIDEPDTLQAYLDKISQWVAEAAARADLLVFPEYAGAEAMAVFGREVNKNLLQATFELQTLVPAIDAHMADLARRYGVYILAPSLPVAAADGSLRNVATMYGPQGFVGAQRKRVLTPFDKDQWQLTAGEAYTLFITPFGLIGVAICYDVEFPLQVRALCEAGATLILCPSCTDSVAGYWRVRLGAMARALENQCVVVQSPTVGSAEWSTALDVNCGAAGIFAPPDSTLSNDGVLALGEMDKPQWLYSTVNLEDILRLRQHGDVRGFSDWHLQLKSGGG